MQPANFKHSKTRVSWADWARAIGIALVVYGHSLGVPPALAKVLYAFHVPLFFFLSGYLHKAPTMSARLGEILLSRVRRLLVPYLCVGIPGVMVWWLVLRKFGKDAGESTSLAQAYGGLFYASGKFRMIQPPPIWFFTALFCTQVIYLLLEKFLRDMRLTLATLVVTVAGYWLNSVFPRGLPLGFETGCLCIGFYHFGQLWKSHASKRAAFSTSAKLATFAAATSVLSYLALIDGRVALMEGQAGTNIFLFYGAACAGISATIALSSLLPRWQPIETIALRSIDVFSLHIYLFSVLSAFYVFALRLPLGVRQEPMIAVFASFVVLIASTWVVSPLWNTALRALRLR